MQVNPCNPVRHSHPAAFWDTRVHLVECQDCYVDPDQEVVGLTVSGANIILAQHDDIPRIQAMLSAAFHRAAALGYQQWWDPFPIEIIEDSVSRGETYLAIKEHTLVGTIALVWEDRTYWGERPPDSGYVHRLCTNAELARPGLGVELLSWAAFMSLRRGREWIRLDTPASNARLRSYYESLGFSFRGETEVTIRGASKKLEAWRCALYERSTRSPV
jgi:ribosomal protein S18 acetylase RimI-like enzyme